MQYLHTPPGKMRKKPFKATMETIKWQLIGCLDFIWHGIESIWRILIIGGVVAGIIGNAAYEYLTKGHFEFANINSLPIVQLIKTYSIFTVFLIIALIIIIVGSFLAHMYRQSFRSVHSQKEYNLKQVNQLNPRDFKLFRYIQKAYISRNADTFVLNILKAMCTQNYQNNALGICIFGKPGQGKTRLAWEAMQAELANWILVRWPHKAQAPFDFSAQRGKQIIVWLDDLHEYANPNESLTINDLPRHFMEEGASIIVIATCRDGEDQLQATKYLGILLEQLIPVNLEGISINEALNLAKILTQDGLEVSSDEFDGTPGSLIFGLQRMTSRYLNLANSAQNVLKAMKLLQSAQIHTYTEKRVKNVSHYVFGLEIKDWRKSYESLDRSDFIRISISNNERILEPIAEIYLEKVVIDYPTPHAMLTDDWINLKECFQHYQDADGLNYLGLATRRQPLNTLQAMYQFSEECYILALKIYFDEHEHLNWAGTQNNLGTMFADQAEQAPKEQAIKLLNKGIDAFNAALTVFSKEETPAGWIMVQFNLGNLLRQKSSLVNDEEKLKLLDNVLQNFADILKIEPQEGIVAAEILSSLAFALCDKASLVEKDKQNQLFDMAFELLRGVVALHAQGHLPFAWASAQTNLGAALSRKANLANNQEERRDLLKQVAQAHRAALTVFTKQGTPQDWARAQFNLGATLRDNAALVEGEERYKFLKEANEAYRAALAVFSKEYTPINWSSTQYQLGNILQHQAQLINGEERLEHLNQALQAYNAALEVYKKANFPSEWAKTQDNLGQALYSKARLLDEQEEHSLLEESIQAFHKALEVYAQEDTQAAWYSAQLNLGISIHRLADIVNGKEGVQILEQAIQTYRTALKSLNKIDHPNTWALLQINLGIALRSLALVTDIQERQPLLDEGLIASQAALEIYSHENKPHNYAKAKQLLGTFLFNKEFPSDQASLIERNKAAIDAFRSALEIFTKENSLNDWARTQFELGNAITSLFELLQENITRDLVVSAINAYQSVVEVYTLQNKPKEWMVANMGIAFAYHVTTLFIEDKNMQVTLLREAQHILGSVLTFQSSNTPQEDNTFATMLMLRIKDDLSKIENTQ